MKIKNTVLSLCLGTVLGSVGFCADQIPQEAQGVGIDRFERNGWYIINNKFKSERQTHSLLHAVGNMVNLGVEVSSVQRECDTNRWRLEKINQESPTQQESSLFIDDIRQSQIDQDTFYTHLAEANYSEAWRMASDNDQGNLWRRQALARAKTDIEKLVRNAVLLDEQDKLQRAATIVAGFLDTPPHPELLVLLNQTRIAAEQRRDIFLANPALAAFTDQIRAQFLQNLLEEN